MIALLFVSTLACIDKDAFDQRYPKHIQVTANDLPIQAGGDFARYNKIPDEICRGGIDLKSHMYRSDIQPYPGAPVRWTGENELDFVEGTVGADGNLAGIKINLCPGNVRDGFEFKLSDCTHQGMGIWSVEEYARGQPVGHETRVPGFKISDPARAPTVLSTSEAEEALVVQNVICRVFSDDPLVKSQNQGLGLLTIDERCHWSRTGGSTTGRCQDYINGYPAQSQCFDYNFLFMEDSRHNIMMRRFAVLMNADVQLRERVAAQIRGEASRGHRALKNVDESNVLQLVQHYLSPQMLRQTCDATFAWDYPCAGSMGGALMSAIKSAIYRDPFKAGAFRRDAPAITDRFVEGNPVINALVDAMLVDDGARSRSRSPAARASGQIESLDAIQIRLAQVTIGGTQYPAI